MIDLDELESLARDVGENETWCLHPNGYSVWTGTEYDTHGDPAQVMVARSGLMTDEVDAARMALVAALCPQAVLELTDRARGLSEVKLVYGPEDNDEVCVVCGSPTSGHTHGECYAVGRSDGRLDENLRCAQALAEAFDIEMCGHFDEVIKELILKKVVEGWKG